MERVNDTERFPHKPRGLGMIDGGTICVAQSRPFCTLICLTSYTSDRSVCVCVCVGSRLAGMPFKVTLESKIKETLE
jgi:hypothetical protein